jgi:peptide/nickel transport system substrate-binding protein
MLHHHRHLVAILLLIMVAVGTTFAQPFQQAPSLDAAVEAGEIPAVELRLPGAPLVVPPQEQIGSYGGTLRLNGGVDRPNWVAFHFGYEPLLRFAPEDRTVVPNVATSIEPNDDGTAYTIRIVPGIRWSDGEPFTVDDIIFWIEDIAGNEEFNPALGLNGWSGGFPPNWRATFDGNVVGPEVEKLDDFTLRVTFPVPNGRFILGQAGWANDVVTRFPKHYLGQFHPAYNEDLDALVAEEGFSEWIELFRARLDWPANPDMPTITPWVLNSSAMGGASAFRAVRNPYYWKVDPEGNQLPYIDEVQWTITQDTEVELLAVLNGEIDAKFHGHWTRVTSFDNKALISDNADRGDYRLIEQRGYLGVVSIDLNLTHRDPVKRAVFNDKDFRIGLSHAINRQEIIDLIYLGQGEPWQFAPVRESDVFDEGFAKQYTEFDPELANSYLDRVLPERNDDGMRLGPDGAPLTILLEVQADRQAWIQTAELIQRYWEAVGIDSEIRTAEPSLIRARNNANDFDTSFGITGAGTVMNMLTFNPYPIYTWPNNFERRAPLWANWYLNLEPAEAPPMEVQQALELHDQLQATPHYEEQLALAKLIIDISESLFLGFGITPQAPRYSVIANDLRNVPEPMLWQPFFPGSIRSEQFFFGN